MIYIRYIPLRRIFLANVNPFSRPPQASVQASGPDNMRHSLPCYTAAYSDILPCLHIFFQMLDQSDHNSELILSVPPLTTSLHLHGSIVRYCTVMCIHIYIWKLSALFNLSTYLCELFARFPSLTDWDCICFANLAPHLVTASMKHMGGVPSPLRGSLPLSAPTGCCRAARSSPLRSFSRCACHTCCKPGSWSGSEVDGLVALDDR